MEDSNSEISGSSFSTPSEPPDIRNWFSSYKYESFVLDTCELGGIVSGEMESDRDEFAVGVINREKLENVNGSGEIRKADDDEYGNLNSNEDSLHPSSILSEPPDLGNWFSSYGYESPLLDTNDGLKDCVSRESECEKDKLVMGEKIKFTDEVANSGQFQETDNSCKQDASEKTCSKKLVKCSDSSVDRKNESHALLSELPHIGNWFSDYVYESPVLDTTDELRHALSEDRESNEDEFVVEERKREERENCNTTRKPSHRYEVVSGEKMCSKEFGKWTSSLTNNKQENKFVSKDLHCAGGKESITRQGGLCFEKILDTSLAVTQMQSSSINSKEGVGSSIFRGGDSLCKFENDYSGKVEFQLPGISRSPGKNDRRSSKKLIDRRGSIEKSSETKVQTDKIDLASHDREYDQVSGSPLRQSTHRSNNKENEGKDIAENGFITARKNKFKRTNYENSLIGRQEILLHCSTNKGGEKDGAMKRKVLGETTNVQHCEALEITGKWRCPQKSKPHGGPPLKQLRLEQWIQRV